MRAIFFLLFTIITFQNPVVLSRSIGSGAYNSLKRSAPHFLQRLTFRAGPKLSLKAATKARLEWNLPSGSMESLVDASYNMGQTSRPSAGLMIKFPFRKIIA